MPDTPAPLPSASFRFCPRCGGGPSVPGPAPVFTCRACGFHYHFNPALAAGVIVEDSEGRLLLIRRAKEPGRGLLGVPGGFVDVGETAEASARRETLEETGAPTRSIPRLWPFPRREPRSPATARPLASSRKGDPVLMLHADAALAPILLVVLAATALAAEGNPAADLVVTNARVWTVDRTRPEAEALAVIGDRIVAVGSKAEIEAWHGPKTAVIDAGGRRVLPGFNDSHLHFFDGSAKLAQVKLKDARSPEELARRIAAQAKEVPKGEWVLGGTWDDQAFDRPRLPTRQDVDALTPETPVFVDRYDGHMALANGVALKLAGITRATKAPPGGEIVRDAAGEPTGVLKDAALGLVSRVIPPLSPEKRLRAIRAGLRHAASLGITSVQDMGPAPGDVAAYAELLERGELTAHVSAAPPETRWEDQARLGLRRAFGSPWLRLGAVKGFADGSLGSTTAFFFEPYTDDPSKNGLLSDEMQPIEAMRERLVKADGAGLQLCIHAIGDRAISIVLDLFEDVVKANGPRDRRWRIEHAQHVAPGDFARFARLGVIASVQPYHAIDDGRWAESRIGAERSKTTYAFRSFLDAGVRLALGTDWPVAPLGPMQTLYAAVTRSTLDGRRPGGWVPEQKITLAEAIEAYTAGAAYAEFQEQDKGRLVAGQLADLVILGEDVFAIPVERLRDVKVEATMVGGRIVYRRAP
jgi:predicted amidohydrolase YtcJ